MSVSAAIAVVIVIAYVLDLPLWLPIVIIGGAFLWQHIENDNWRRGR
jgi:4-hydroxybenzoate polyprenyltransferase